MNMIHSAADMEQLIHSYGFLPFFANAVPGWSIEDHTPPELWFAKDVDGPWEWKGPVTADATIAYGKFFHNKAGFIAKEWIPDFVNYRRDGYDYDSRVDEGFADTQENILIHTLEKTNAIRSKELRALTGLNSKQGGARFDKHITKLQMLAYVTTAGFTYETTKAGVPYGWGIALYALMEQVFPRSFVRSAYKRKPKKSEERIMEYLMQKLGPQYEKDIRTLIERR